jgi:hypothetical protein
LITANMFFSNEIYPATEIEFDLLLVAITF